MWSFHEQPAASQPGLMRWFSRSADFSMEVFDNEVAPASLQSIAPILRVAAEIQSECPHVAYLCRNYAFQKADRLDPSSSGRGVRQFKTSLSLRLERDWDMLSFIRSLKTMVLASNAVVVITFPISLLSPSFSKRWQHLADTLLSVRAIQDEDKELAKLLTGYQDMVGLLSVHKVARFNTQVPVILEATTFSIKLQKRRLLVLKCLNQAPVDGSSWSSYGTSGSCSGSSKTRTLDF